MVSCNCLFVFFFVFFLFFFFFGVNLDFDLLFINGKVSSSKARGKYIIRKILFISKSSRFL